jgi:hypothetical protein
MCIGIYYVPLIEGVWVQFFESVTAALKPSHCLIQVHNPRHAKSRKRFGKRDRGCSSRDNKYKSEEVT